MHLKGTGEYYRCTNMERKLTSVDKNGSGYGDGYRDGYGDGYGNGSGYGDGYGNGFGCW